MAIVSCTTVWATLNGHNTEALDVDSSVFQKNLRFGLVVQRTTMLYVELQDQSFPPS